MTNGKKPIEAFALSRVPREQRKSWVDMVMVQAGMVICIPAFLLGSMLAEGMPTLQAMVAGVIGYGMVLVLTLILGIQGADLGIPTCAISTGGELDLLRNGDGGDRCLGDGDAEKSGHDLCAAAAPDHDRWYGDGVSHLRHGGAFCQ